MIPAATLDRLVLRILEGLETDDLEVERLIRMGVHGEKSVRRAAKRLGVRGDSLAQRLHHAGLPQPRDLLTWGRLLLAMHSWEPAAAGRKIAPRSLEQVALEQRWSGQSTMSMSLRRHAGIYPRQWLRDDGSLEQLVELFLERWEERAPPSKRKREVAA